MFDFGKTLTKQGLLAVVIAMLLLSPALAVPNSPAGENHGDREITINGVIDIDTGLSMYSFADIDIDGFLNFEDSCPSVNGSSYLTTRGRERRKGGPDNDGDGYADTIDMCPNNSDHQNCLEALGLATSPEKKSLGTCQDLENWKSDLQFQKYLAIGAGGLAALITAFPGLNVVAMTTVVSVSAVGFGILGISASTLWLTNVSSVCSKITMVLAKLGASGQCA